MEKILWTWILIVLMAFLAPSLAETQKTYVGSKVCGECHDEQFRTFTAYAKKAHSYEAIQRLRKGLTEDEYKECYQCHTTGYGQEGGSYLRRRPQN